MQINYNLKLQKQIKNLLEIKNHIYQYENEYLKQIIDSFSLSKINQYFELLKNGIKEKPEYLTLDFFKEGASVPGIDKDNFIAVVSRDYQYINQFQFSTRITNVQLLDSEIKNFTKKMYQVTGIPFTCNLYITPNSESNCFVYHTDYQITIIAQLTGKKIWHFPKEEDESLKYNLQQHFSNQKFENEHIFEVQRGDIFTFGQNSIHRAYQSGKEMSIHLTFAGFKTNHMDLLNSIFKKMENSFYENRLMHNYHIEKEKLKNTLNLFHNDFLQSINEDFITDFIRASHLNEIEIMKKGRKY